MLTGRSATEVAVPHVAEALADVLVGLDATNEVIHPGLNERVGVSRGARSEPVIRQLVVGRREGHGEHVIKRRERGATLVVEGEPIVPEVRVGVSDGCRKGMHARDGVERARGRWPSLINPATTSGAGRRTSPWRAIAYQ